MTALWLVLGFVFGGVASVVLGIATPPQAVGTFVSMLLGLALGWFYGKEDR